MTIFMIDIAHNTVMVNPIPCRRLRGCYSCSHTLITLECV